MDGYVCRIFPLEKAEVDLLVVAVLRAEVGEAACDRLIERIAERLQDATMRLRQATQDKDWGLTARLSHSMVGIAGQLGFKAVVRVAAMLAEVAEREDWPAACALAARLTRLTDAGLCDLIDGASLQSI